MGRQALLPDSTEAEQKPIIGLIGGIGSGKSTVARLFSEEGAAIVDSDALAGEQLLEDEVVTQLKSWWGDSICDSSGGIDRRRVADIVFADPVQKKRLEEFLHPRINEKRKLLIKEYRQNGNIRCIILDSPLLLEAGLDQLCDVVVFVDASPNVRLKRVTRNRGWSEDNWRRREKSQKSLDIKRSRADHVVVNNSSDIDKLRYDVHALMDKLVKTDLPDS